MKYWQSHYTFPQIWNLTTLSNTDIVLGELKEAIFCLVGIVFID